MRSLTCLNIWTKPYKQHFLIDHFRRRFPGGLSATTSSSSRFKWPSHTASNVFGELLENIGSAFFCAQACLDEVLEIGAPFPFVPVGGRQQPSRHNCGYGGGAAAGLQGRIIFCCAPGNEKRKLLAKTTPFSKAERKPTDS